MVVTDVVAVELALSARAVRLQFRGATSAFTSKLVSHLTAEVGLGHDAVTRFNTPACASQLCAVLTVMM